MIPFSFIKRNAASYLPESIALFDEMAVQPNAVRKGLINTMIGDLMAAGIWSELDTLWILAAHDQQASLLNWKSPTNNTLSIVSTPVFTTDMGWEGDGAGGYLDTNFDPSTASHYQQTDGCHGIYCATIVADSKLVCGMTDSVRPVVLIPDFAGGNIYVGMNSAYEINAGDGGLGLTTGDRPNNTTVLTYRNGASYAGSAGNTSDSIPSLNDFILGLNYNGSIYTTSSASRVTARFHGASLNSTEQTDLYNIIETYMVALGAQA